MNFDIDALRTLLGRFHIAVVHFPIALLVIAAGLDMLDRRRESETRAATVRTLLRLAAPAAVVAATFGWLHADQEPLGSSVERTLWLHRWSGVVCAVLACIAAIGAGSAWVRKFIAWPAAILVLVAGHFGGALVYGDDYLLEPLRASATAAEPANVLTPPADPTFAAAALPIFEELCVECHGPKKSKGHLRLDVWSTAWFDGSESAPLIVPGKPAESELWRRLSLPLDDEDHMPPTKERQPTPAELAAIERWITTGAQP